MASRTGFHGSVITTLGPSGTTPIPGATVQVTGENGFSARTATASNGEFQFSNVPDGGITLNVSAIGFTDQVVELFLGPIYSAPGLGGAGLVVGMSPGPANETLVTSYSDFPDLEQLVSTLWAGTVLLGIVGWIGWIGGRSLSRAQRMPWAVAGGIGAGLSPVALYVLGVQTAFPWLGWASLAPALLGLAGAMLALGHLTIDSAPEPPEWRPSGPPP